MASSSTWAQDVITCDLCDKPTHQFCNNCNVTVCVDCIDKHVESLKSQMHDIVPFKERKKRLVFSACASHANQKGLRHCQQCDIPICFKCAIGPHSGHTIKDMRDIVQQIKEEINRETRLIVFLTSRIESNGAKIDQKISDMTGEFEEMEKKGENLRRIWHEEVDTIFNVLQSTIRTTKEKGISALRSHQSRLQDKGTKLTLITQRNKEILESNKVSDVTGYKQKVKKIVFPMDFDVKIPSLKTKACPGSELNIELGEYKATLTQTSISTLTEENPILIERKSLDTAKVVACISSGIKPLGPIICIGTHEAWVRGQDKFIRRIDLHGFLKSRISTQCKLYPNDISVTKHGELIYSDYDSRTVNIVTKGMIETLITLPRGWYPGGLCCSRSGDILVSMGNLDKSHNKIVRYQGRAAAQEIHKDKHNQPYFRIGKYGVYVEENNNGDICASDMNAKKVMVMDKTGKVRFRYDGTPARRIKPFFPACIATDSLSQIIVTDVNNDCLHLLDQNGQFLRCVDNCGLLSPVGLSVDSEGRLWVGCQESGVIKVIQYLE
ncbi:uncharacterized protein LOC134261044 [Saccostrea cucullata]|uniref:uncharacterized protein LOC134261044 n=1 Tax=Saccostrea cuccullata TaxID=36930 RepID=UPI002ED1D456